MLQASDSAKTDAQRIRDYPFFYGWVIFAVATLGVVCTGPGQTYCISIFLEYIIADLSLSRSTVSSLYTAGTLLGSFALPFVGRRFDRHGARYMITLVSLLFGLACVYVGTVQNAVMLGIGFFLIRMLGQGSLTLICTNAINQWWVQRRGPLLGLSGTFVSLFGLGVTPNVVHWLIPHLGWRATYVLLGAFLSLGFAPIAFYLVRNRPETYGILPDGEGREKGKPVASGEGRLQVLLNYFRRPVVAIAEENWTLDEALQTPVFWVFSLGRCAVTLISTGLLFHIVSIFAENGLPASFAAVAFLPVALTAAATNLMSGCLVETFRLRSMLSVSLILLAIALVIAPHLSSSAHVSSFGVCLGACIGLSQTVHTVAWARYYGRIHLGSITGLVSTFVVAASAIGPLPMGLAYDITGNYDAILYLFAVIPVLLSGASILVDRPRKADSTLSGL